MFYMFHAGVWLQFRQQQTCFVWEILFFDSFRDFAFAGITITSCCQLILENCISFNFHQTCTISSKLHILTSNTTRWNNCIEFRSGRLKIWSWAKTRVLQNRPPKEIYVRHEAQVLQFEDRFIHKSFFSLLCGPRCCNYSLK